MTPHAEYNIATGQTTGRRICCDDAALLAANAAPGCAWVQTPEHPERMKVEQVTDDMGDSVAMPRPTKPPKPADTVAVCWLWSESEQAWQPELTVAAHMANTRTERDRRLSECDWVVTKAQETGQPVPKPWREYRQALRDVTKQPGFPTDVVWPIKPE